MLLKPCGNRRAHVCAPCSEVYRGDAWQLVASGAARRQGRARDASRGIRWCSRRSRRRASGRCTRCARPNGKRLPCRPRSRGETCPHGRSLACGKRHGDDDPCLGEAICPDCFDYERCGAVEPQRGPAVQAHRTYVERELARQAGLTQKAARERVRVVVREGRRVPAPRRRALPHALAPRRRRRRRAGRRRRAEFDAQLLVDAITAALPKATVPAEDDDAEPYAVGRQHDVRALDLGADPQEAARVAGYIAKYATKSTEDAGGVALPDRARARAARPALPRPRAAADHQRVARGRPRGGRRASAMRRWAHQFGFGGHCFTKSRRFSTTFKALREARAAHAAGPRRPRARPPRKVTTT